MGEGSIDILFVLGWVTSIERMWAEPRLARFFERLASFARVMVFDKRGVGLSDRVSEDRLPSLEVRMDDARAVMDSVGSERAVVLGVSEGGPMATLFAATYPERTIALIVFGTSLCWNNAPDYPWSVSSEAFEAEHREYADARDRLWGTKELASGRNRHPASRSRRGHDAPGRATSYGASGPGERPFPLDPRTTLLMRAPTRSRENPSTGLD